MTLTEAYHIVKESSGSDNPYHSPEDIAMAEAVLSAAVEALTPASYELQLEALTGDECPRLWALRTAFTMGQVYERNRK